jgi:hypothetical protein
MPDRQVHIFTGEIDMMKRRAYSQIDAGMRIGESAKPMHKPLRSKIR